MTIIVTGTSADEDDFTIDEDNRRSVQRDDVEHRPRAGDNDDDLDFQLADDDDTLVLTNTSFT